MTWQTPLGDRYLLGNESRVFRAGLRQAIEYLEMRNLDCSGTLLAEQSRKSLLHLFTFVGHHLLRETPEVAPLNAWTEGAVGIIFREIESLAHNELFLYDGDLDAPYARAGRELIWNATDQQTRTEMANVIDGPACTDNGTWNILVDMLRSRVLWDHDWEINLEWDSESVMESLGIETSYFDWHMVVQGKNRDAIHMLGDLCGYRRGNWEGTHLA